MTESFKKLAGPRSVLRALDILQTLAARGQGRTLAELTADLALPKTSVFSLLKVMEAAGYLQQRDGRYLLGPQALRLGVGLNQAESLTRSARPVLQWLAQDTQETIMLGVPSEGGYEIAYMDVIESDAPLRFAVRPGNRRPLYCAASGKAVLAFLPEDIQQEYFARTTFVKFTQDTSDRDELIRLMPEIRERGVILDANGIIDGAASVASPGFDEAGRVICSISIAGPTTRIFERQVYLEKLCVQAGERISRILGYQGSYPPEWRL